MSEQDAIVESVVDQGGFHVESDAQFDQRRNRTVFFFSSRRRHTRSLCDWSSDVCSSDLMAVRLRFQADYAGYSQDSTHAAGFAGPSDLSSGSVMRRAYFGVEGKVYNDFAYELRLNAGGADGGSFGASGVPNAGEGDPLLNKAVITYVGIPNWHFNVGVLEPSFMMEGTTSSANLTWLERPEIENIAADAFGAGDSRRGIEVGWNKVDALWPGDNLAFDVAWTGGKTGSATNHGSAAATASPPGAGDENDQVL